MQNKAAGSIRVSSQYRPCMWRMKGVLKEHHDKMAILNHPQGYPNNPINEEVRDGQLQSKSSFLVTRES